MQEWREAMTYKEFLVGLSLTPRKWYLDKDGQIGCGEGKCPLGYFMRFFMIPEPDRASAALGLTYNVAKRIADAADNKTRGSRTRRDLLKACGLKEKP